jgi:hypothetical protein
LRKKATRAIHSSTWHIWVAAAFGTGVWRSTVRRQRRRLWHG